MTKTDQEVKNEQIAKEQERRHLLRNVHPVFHEVLGLKAVEPVKKEGEAQ